MVMREIPRQTRNDRKDFLRHSRTPVEKISRNSHSHPEKMLPQGKDGFTPSISIDSVAHRNSHGVGRDGSPNRPYASEMRPYLHVLREKVSSKLRQNDSVTSRAAQESESTC